MVTYPCATIASVPIFLACSRRSVVERFIFASRSRCVQECIVSTDKKDDKRKRWKQKSETKASQKDTS